MFLGEVEPWVVTGTTWVGFGIGTLSLGGLIIKYFILPSLKNFISEETAELKESVEKMASIIHSELRPNGGTSIRDKIVRIEADVKTLKSKLHFHE